MFFFFKQKTAYEMRISDWSSDVCSSDLSLVALLVGSATCFSPTVALAIQQQRQPYDMPAQDLQDALRSAATIPEMQLTASPPALAGKNATKADPWRCTGVVSTCSMWGYSLPEIIKQCRFPPITKKQQ